MGTSPRSLFINIVMSAFAVTLFIFLAAAMIPAAVLALSVVVVRRTLSTSFFFLFIIVMALFCTPDYFANGPCEHIFSRRREHNIWGRVEWGQVGNRRYKCENLKQLQLTSRISLHIFCVLLKKGEKGMRGHHQ